MFINHTPFPGIAFDTIDATRRLNTTVIVRGRFRFHAGSHDNEWELRPDPDQGDLLASDIHYENELTQPVRYESDYAPFKPAADVILNANAHAPGNLPRNQWHCGISIVQDQKLILNKWLRVTGPRLWQKTLNPMRKWHLSKPVLVTQVSLRSSNAYGGCYEEEDPDKPDETRWRIRHPQNPAGCGALHKKDSARERKAPQLEYPEDPIESPNGDYRSAGFGWVARAASPRIEKAGTFDQHWLDNDHPYLPKDFHNTYYQGAPEDQQIAGFLKGNERITLHNLLPGVAKQGFTLPDYRLLFRYCLERQDEIFGSMSLDTLLIDIESRDPDAWRASLTWRSYFPALEDGATTEAMIEIPEAHLAPVLQDQIHGG